MIGRYQPKWICVFLLHPSNAALPGCCQIVAIREIEPIFKVLFDIICHLLRFSVKSYLYEMIDALINTKKGYLL